MANRNNSADFDGNKVIFGVRIPLLLLTYCGFCGHKFERSHNFCPNCGVKKQVIKNCCACGAGFQDNHTHCWSCGCEITKEPRPLASC